jgi:hypothetical protein
MGAKLIAGLLIFGLLPILVTLPWWLYCGYGVHQVYEAGLDSLGVQVVPVAFGLLIAALVGSFARFLAGTIFAAAAIALFLAAFVKMAKTHLFFHGLDVIVDSSAASAARLSILYAFAIVGWAVVVAQQFLTRRLNRSLVLLSFTAALLGVDAIWWPLAFKEDFFRTRPAPADGAVLDDRVAIHHLKGAALHRRLRKHPGGWRPSRALPEMRRARVRVALAGRQFRARARHLGGHNHPDPLPIADRRTLQGNSRFGLEAKRSLQAAAQGWEASDQRRSCHRESHEPGLGLLF